MKQLLLVAALASFAGGVFIVAPAAQTTRVRARDLVVVAGTLPPGPLNASPTSRLARRARHDSERRRRLDRLAKGPSGPGVTAVLPRKDVWFNGVYAATHTLNGDGEMTGTHWIRDRETLMHPPC